MSTFPNDKKLDIDLDLELDPESLDDEDLDENELVLSGDGYYILGNNKNRNFW